MPSQRADTHLTVCAVISLQLWSPLNKERAGRTARQRYPLQAMYAASVELRRDPPESAVMAQAGDGQVQGVRSFLVVTVAWRDAWANGHEIR